MAKIIIPSLNKKIEASAARSILNNLLLEGIKIKHNCGGKAQCGTCRIKVLSGKGSLSPMREQEKERLRAAEAGPDERLACQTNCAGTAEIEIGS